MKKLFLDSSVLFSAVNSPSGGSAKLFTLNNTHLQTSTYVLTEVERNVRIKLHQHHLERFFTIVSKIQIRESSLNQAKLIEAKKIVPPKDAPVLIDAKQSKADVLITLDKKHILTPKAKAYFKPGKIKTPKQELMQ